MGACLGVDLQRLNQMSDDINQIKGEVDKLKAATAKLEEGKAELEKKVDGTKQEIEDKIKNLSGGAALKGAGGGGFF